MTSRVPTFMFISRSSLRLYAMTGNRSLTSDKMWRGYGKVDSRNGCICKVINPSLTDSGSFVIAWNITLLGLRIFLKFYGVINVVNKIFKYKQFNNWFKKSSSWS